MKSEIYQEITDSMKIVSLLTEIRKHLRIISFQKMNFKAKCNIIYIACIQNQFSYYKNSSYFTKIIQLFYHPYSYKYKYYTNSCKLLIFKEN